MCIYIYMHIDTCMFTYQFCISQYIYVYYIYTHRERERFGNGSCFFLPKRWIVQSGLSQMPLVPGDERHVRSVHVRQRRRGVCSFHGEFLFGIKQVTDHQMSSCNHKWRAEEVTSPEADPEESEGEANVLQKSRCANCIKSLVLQKTLVLSGWAIPCAGRS